MRLLQPHMSGGERARGMACGAAGSRDSHAERGRQARGGERARGTAKGAAGSRDSRAEGTGMFSARASLMSCAPAFSTGSSSSMARAMDTPSLMTCGTPYDCSSTTLRPAACAGCLRAAPDRRAPLDFRPGAPHGHHTLRRWRPACQDTAARSKSAACDPAHVDILGASPPLGNCGTTATATVTRRPAAAGQSAPASLGTAQPPHRPGRSCRAALLSRVRL